MATSIINLSRTLSDDQAFDTKLLDVVAGDTINFSFATLSGFLGGADLPVDGYLTVLVNGGELSQFTGGTTGFGSTPPGSEAGTDFLYRQGTFSFSDVQQANGDVPFDHIILTYTDPGGVQEFPIPAGLSISLSVHLQDHGDPVTSTPISDPDIVGIKLTVDNPARGTLSQPEQVTPALTTNFAAAASDFNTLSNGFAALSNALGANDSSNLITLMGDELAASIAPQLGDVNAAIQTIFARAEAGQSETPADPDSLALSLVSMIDKAAADMLNAIGVESADAAYDEIYTAPAWSFPDIPGASPEANALVASSYALLQDCAEMLTAAQRYQGAVLAGDTEAQATQDAAFNAAFQQYSQDRVSLSTDVDAFLIELGVTDVNFEADTTLSDVETYLGTLTDPMTEDTVLAGWMSAITSAFPGMAAPGQFLSLQPTVITDDVDHALFLFNDEEAPNETGSVQAAIDGISNTLSVENLDPVIDVTESGDPLPLVEAGIDAGGNPVAGTTTHTYTLALTDPDGGDTPIFSNSGWTLVTGTVYRKTGVYGATTLDITTGDVTYTLDHNDPDTQALFAGQAVAETISVTAFDGNGGLVTENLQFGIVGTNDAPINAVPAGTQGAIRNTDLQFNAANGNLIAITDDSATPTVTLTAANGLLTLSGVAGLSFTEGTGAGDITMSFSGSLADINAALDGLIFTPDTDYLGPASVTIETNDGEGGVDTDTINIGVDPPNAAPVANDDTAAINEYGSIAGNVIAGDAVGGVADTDADLDDLSVSGFLGGAVVAVGAVGQAFAGAYGVLTLNANGSYSYVSNDNQPIAAGTTVDDNFTYTITDGVITDTATLTVSVTGAGTGTSAANHLLANDLGSTLSGLGGNDILDGSDGIDILVGGAGRDTLTGDLGADRFKLNAKTETPKGANRDVILDFSGVGGELDRIDLSGIDAKKGGGNQAFKFIKMQKFHHKAGELHIVKHAGYVTVEGDIDGNGRADFQIDVHNLTDTLNSLLKGDFIL